MIKAAGRAARSAYAFQSSANVWWSDTRHQSSTRAQNLTIWQIPTEQSQALAQLAQRSMQLQITVQDGTCRSTTRRQRESPDQADQRHLRCSRRNLVCNIARPALLSLQLRVSAFDGGGFRGKS